MTQFALLPVFTGQAAERSYAGLCAVTGCTGAPVHIDGIGARWCARCRAVIEAQNQPVKGRSGA